MTFFPSIPGVIQAISGRVAGALVKSGRFKPSNEGSLIYLNANPNIQTVIDKIEPAGGKIIATKYKNLAGYIAVFTDTEGNKIGLHAEA
jgi:predicted enzyme related to lactoylglutathione lyase